MKITPQFTVSKIVDKYIEIQESAGIPAPSASTILDVWGVMIELNAGKSVALTVANKDKMMQYFMAHGISADDFNVVVSSGVDSTTDGIAVLSRIKDGISCNC